MKRSGRSVRYLAVSWLAVALLALGGAARVAAAGPKLITNCSNDRQLQAAAATGGSYPFAVPCAVTLTKPLTIDKNFSLNGAGYRVLIAGPSTGSHGRVFTIEGGQVTLTGVSFRGEIDGFGTLGAQSGDSSTGGPGQPGADLVGGAMLIDGGAHVTVIGTAVSDALPDIGTLNSAGGDGGDAAMPTRRGAAAVTVA
jgi:hypothetical protein